ncbi:MAG TPA: hypothetical protein VF885_26645, partial [Arthrobacter sp.]
MSLSKTSLVRPVRSWVIVNDDLNAAAHPVENFNPNQLTGGWVSVGHTPKDAPVKITTNGGEVTLVDTAAADGVDAITTPKNYVFDFDALQWDTLVFDLAFNGTYNSVTKEYSVPTNSSPLQKSAQVVMKTAAGKYFYVRGYGTITAGDAPTLSFTELSKLPLRVALMGDGQGYAFHLGGDAIQGSVNPPAGGGTGGSNASASAVVTDGEISAINVTNGGSGYLVAPDVDIIDNGATPGVGATAHAVINGGGSVTSVVVDTPGSGY